MSTLPKQPTILKSPPKDIEHIAHLAEFVAQKLDGEGYKIALIATRAVPNDEHGVEFICMASLPPEVLAPLLRQYATSIEVARGHTPAS